MSKKDVIEIMVGCISWAIVIALAILTSLGIIDLIVVFKFICFIIVVLCIFVESLLLLWLSGKK